MHQVKVHWISKSWGNSQESAERALRPGLSRIVGSLFQVAGVALVFAVNVVLSVILLFDDRRDPAVCFGGIAIPLQLIAAVIAGNTSVLVRRSLSQIGPPEILQRLSAALKYLE